MTSFNRIASFKPQPTGTSIRMIVEWEGHSYSINQNKLNQYNTAEEIKADLDAWTMYSYGYVINDIWFHKNADGTWAIATGAEPIFWGWAHP